VVAAGAVLLVIWRRYVAARCFGASATDHYDKPKALRYALFGRKKNSADELVARGLLVGADNRNSTSKTTAALWTAILVYFILTMAFVVGFNREEISTIIGQISPLYLILLGGPFAAAVLAKVSVSNSVASGEQQKSQADHARVADVFSDDDGNTDLVDVQYLAFNLLAAGIVLVQFLHAPGFGAPNIPDFLAGLTGTSAATFVANKALSSRNPPKIDRLAPNSVRPGGQVVVVVGSNLIAQGDNNPPRGIRERWCRHRRRQAAETRQRDVPCRGHDTARVGEGRPANPVGTRD
jgi:hypothetical protein